MEISIGGRTIPLALTTYELIAIQEDVGCTIGQLRENVFGIEHDMETDNYSFNMSTDSEKMRKFGALIRILGNAGLEEAGETPDLTDKWILRHVKPGMILPLVIIMTQVINDAMSMEIKPDQTETGPVDEGLEEENRKKEQES